MKTTCPQCDAIVELQIEADAGDSESVFHCPSCSSPLHVAAFEDGRDRDDAVFAVVCVEEENNSEQIQTNTAGKNGSVLASLGLWVPVGVVAVAIGLLIFRSWQTQNPSAVADSETASPAMTDTLGMSGPDHQPPDQIDQVISREVADPEVLSDSPIVKPVPPAVHELVTVEVDLAGPAIELHSAGRGRFIVARIEEKNQLQVIDLVQKNVVSTTTIPADVIIAAGKDCILLIHPEVHRAEIRRLPEFTLLAEAELPADCQMIAAACGVSVNGPFLLQGYSITDVSGQNSASRYFLLDIKSRVCKVVETPSTWLPASNSVVRMRASEDGRAFAAWSPYANPQGLRTLVFDAEMQTAACNYEPVNVGHAAPGPAGDKILLRNAVMQLGAGKSIGLSRFSPDAFPAVTGPLMIRYRPERQQQLQILGPDFGPVIFEVTGSFPASWPQEVPSRPQLTRDCRIALVPALNRLAILNTTDDAIVIAELNVAEFPPSDPKNPVLEVVSTPPSSLVSGQRLTYNMAAISTAGSPEFTLEFAPSGAVLTKSGCLTWDVTLEDEATVQPFVVTVRDKSGRSVFHSFTCVVSSEDEELSE